MVHQSWIQEMGAFLRTLDPLHLVGAATEGFFVRNTTTNFHLYNPGGRRLRRCTWPCVCLPAVVLSIATGAESSLI